MEWKTSENLRKTRENDWDLDGVKIQGIRFLAGFLASPYGVGNENAKGSLAKSL